MNRRATMWLVSMFLLLGAHTPAAHAGGEDRDPAPLTPAAEFARAAPRIVNGTLTSSYPAVGALLIPFDPAAPSIPKEILDCSGTMIGCDTFLTAAHCVCPLPKTGAQCQGDNAPDPADYAIFLQHAGFFAVSSITVHPDYKLGVSSDVAVVRLSSPVTGIAPIPINTKHTPPLGTLGTIVGFGRSGGDMNTNLDYGLKRVGKITTSSCPSPIPNATYVCWAFTEPLGPAGQDSTTCQGDSGGPLLTASGSHYVVAGTTSGTSAATCLPPTNGLDDSTFNDRAWIQAQAGSDLSNTRCGDIAQAETADAAVLTASDQLSSTTPERLHTIRVPAQATLLRIALNGDDHGDNNFDLYVQSPTTADGYECSSTRNSQYEFCEIHNPEAGTWKVTVTRTTGGGRYELTATTFAPGAGPGARSKEGQICAKAIRGWFTTFFKADLAAQQACIDKVNKGKATPPCPDAKASTAIAKAAAKITPAKVAVKCPAATIPTLGLGGVCAGAANADALAACIVSETERAVDAVLAAEYSQPAAALSSVDQQKCQAAVAQVTGKQYVANRIGILSTCLAQRDAGKVASCPDPSAADKLTKAVVKVAPAIGKKCSDAVVQTLNSATFGGSCATATTAAVLASCQVSEHDAVIDDVLLCRLQSTGCAAAVTEASVADLQAAMVTGRVNALTLVEHYLERIEALDRSGPTLRAVIEINPDARAIAQALDAERQQHGARGPLHGIPVLLKDNIDTADQLLTTAGSVALIDAPATRDATVAERLRNAGAVLLGKTNLTEWANMRSLHATSGWSARGGQTLNPYALDHNPSGSSSGSAVAVAANLCTIALGTETDGSVVSPAAAGGVVGLKPTVGLTSRAGVIPLAHTQDSVGVLARTVADVATVLGALVGVDPRDPATEASAEHIPETYTQFLSADGLRNARIGIPRQVFFGEDAASDAIAEQAIGALRAAGAIVIDPADVPTAATLASDDFEFRVLLYEFKADLNSYLADRSGLSVRTLADLIAFNNAHADVELALFGQEIFNLANPLGSLETPAYLSALETSLRLSRDEGLDAVIGQYQLDALVAPTGPPAWVIDYAAGDPPLPYPLHSVAARAGYPLITVPAGFARGLPVGISFVGRAFSEPTLVRLAYAFEQATHARRVPQFLAKSDQLSSP